MVCRILSLLLVVVAAAFIQVCFVEAQTNPVDSSAVNSLKDVWKNTPPNWVGPDPCNSNWDGIDCTNSRVTSIILPSMGLTGTFSGDIISLSVLQILDLSYNKGLTGPLPQQIGNLKKLTNLILVGCSFSGTIPASIGSLQSLVYLSLNSNGFTGEIPSSIGTLSNLYWLDLADNNLEGTIPVSTSTTPGLDLLVRTKHFHFGQNQLMGTIPDQLFSSDMSLIHVLFDGNNLSGSIPSTLGLVQNLEVVRLDRNKLTGTIPESLNKLSSVQELFLSNNELSGAPSNLTGMTSLTYLDLSNNSFDASYFASWYAALRTESLTTLVMEGTELQGLVPTELFSETNLQSVKLQRNQLNGSLDVGTSVSSQLQLIDLENNLISSYMQRPGLSNVDVILVHNPICDETGSSNEKYCTISTTNSVTYSTQPYNCIPSACTTANQISSPKCICAFPYTGLLVFRAPSFSNLGNTTIFVSLEEKLMNTFKSHQIPVDSVALSNLRKDLSEYLDVNLQVFPSAVAIFNRSVISKIGFVLSNQTFKPPPGFGPFYFIGDTYLYFSDNAMSNRTPTGIIVGATVGGVILLLLLIIAGIYAYRQKKRAERATEQNNPFARWDSTKHSGGVPQLKSARSFSFEEVKKYTNNFSEANGIGSGGYGKVYRGTLPDGQLVAIKRAQQGSMQGALEFKTEIELLSRLHHKNLVSLVGFCFDRGEQMLIYEYMPNSSLKDTLSGKTGIVLDWIRRLKVALGSARGIAYLHELADPPIIHRDIKSTNILLDERLVAKVADFGLSKLLGDTEKGHVTTQVKGTMGYLDPEYYMTQQLTEKSDVYSFGVVMLEILTGKSPIERGKYIVREIKMAIDRTKDFYNLNELVDPAIGLDTTLKGLNKFIDLAMKCVQESGSDRPSMGEVVKEIENILQQAGLNPNADSASSSATYDEASKGVAHHPYINAFDYSGAFPPPKVEPK